MKYCSNKNCVAIIALLVFFIIFTLDRTGILKKYGVLSYNENGKAQVFSSFESDEGFLQEDMSGLDESGLENGNDADTELNESEKPSILQSIRDFLNNNEEESDTPVDIGNLPEASLEQDSCGVYDRERLYVFSGETFDVYGTGALFRNSNVWSTTDGENWLEIAKTTPMGEKWEIMPVVVNNEAYVFGGKYKKGSSAHDLSSYKTSDMINWKYLGELPATSREYDKSVVYFKNKFWLISSEKTTGIWSSVDGAIWKQEVSSNLWDGDTYGVKAGSDIVGHKKGGYTSNSLGAYVLGNKIWYVVGNHTGETVSNKKVYSSVDGINWKDEGIFTINGKNDKFLDIAWNTNPSPVMFNNAAWVISSNRTTGTPMVIKTVNGRDWKLVSNVTTNYSSPRYYSTMVAFNHKLWTLGGFTGDNLSNVNYDVWSSVNGVLWNKANQIGTKFVGPADRYLAGGLTLTYRYSTKGSDLMVDSTPEKMYYKDDVQKGATLGNWSLNAKSTWGVTFDGNIVITGLKFVGSDIANVKLPTSPKRLTISSLNSAVVKNLKVYQGSKLIGSVASFSGPFYDSSGVAIPQTIKLNNPIVLKQNDSAQIKLIGDITLSDSVKSFTTYMMPEFDFADENSKACSVYLKQRESKLEKVPGNTSLRYRNFPI